VKDTVFAKNAANIITRNRPVANGWEKRGSDATVNLRPCKIREDYDDRLLYFRFRHQLPGNRGEKSAA
jgi:hypothetical protein